MGTCQVMGEDIGGIEYAWSQISRSERHILTVISSLSLMLVRSFLNFIRNKRASAVFNNFCILGRFGSHAGHQQYMKNIIQTIYFK